MNTVYWSTEEYHADNSETMSDFLDNINMLDIHMIDGSYAEGSNGRGELYAIHVSGHGSFYDHKAEFTLLEAIPNE